MKAQVAITDHKKPEPSDEDVLRMVRDALRQIGMERFVTEGERVLLKPNQTIFFHARDGVTTDPRVVAALVTLAKEQGASEIIVGDGSGGDLRSARVLDVTGVRRLAEQAGADQVVGFEDLEHEDVVVRVKGETYRLPVPRLLREVDVVVNVPKAKTHFEDPITCCLKNWVGIIHQEARPEIMVDGVLEAATVALHREVPAALNVVDGLWAGVGDGPAANESTWLGCIVAGVDPVAVDRVVTRLMGLEARHSAFQEAAVALGIGTSDDARIEVLGGAVEALRVQAKATRHGFDHLPIRVLEGEGVTWAGSLGHLKSIADVFDAYGFWPVVERIYGKPTFMVGRIHDPDFEANVDAGPYFVLDDAAYDEYKRDDRVCFIPGHPATHNIFPAIFDRLHVSHVGPNAMRLARVVKDVQAYFHFRAWKPTERQGGASLG